MTHRAPNLTPERIDAIIEIIRGWEGRLTWPALIQAIGKRMRATYTRQALHKRERIRVAYETYRARQSNGSCGRPLPAAVKACMERVDRLEQENAELKQRETLLLEQFVRWAYNAAARGLSEDFLNQPLPPTNRQGNPKSRQQT